MRRSRGVGACTGKARERWRGLRLRSSRQSVSAQTCPAEDGGMEPPQDMEKVSNTEDDHNRRVHSLYTAPLFQRISQTNLENMQARGSEFSSAAWTVQGRDKTSNLSKVKSKEGPGYRLLNVSGGSGGWSLSPDPVEGQAGPRGQCASGGRETCPRLESGNTKKAERRRIDTFELCVVLEKTLESPLDCKEIQSVHPKGDQSWLFIGGTDVEAETLILWPPDAES